jgi:hypothetical protein
MRSQLPRLLAAIAPLFPVIACGGAVDGPSPRSGSRSAVVGPYTYSCQNAAGDIVAGCSVVAEQLDENTMRYVVDQPIVNESNTDYRMIELLPGDTVTVSASGCVQTGGKGQTWKDYVTPSRSRTA